ncbi:MAG: hypothetical protein ACLTDS_08855 [Bianqueaceae bacterium]
MYGKVVNVVNECLMVEFGTNRSIIIPVRRDQILSAQEPDLTQKKIEDVEPEPQDDLVGGDLEEDGLDDYDKYLLEEADKKSSKKEPVQEEEISSMMDPFSGLGAGEGIFHPIRRYAAGGPDYKIFLYKGKVYHMHYMKQYLKPYWKQFLIGPVFKLLEAILELFMPIMMARIINEGVLQQDTDFILQQGGLMALIAAIGMGSAWICQYSASVASQGFGTRLRSICSKNQRAQLLAD